MNAAAQQQPAQAISEYLQCIPSAAIAAAARGEIDLAALFRQELSSRGLNLQGQWVGFKQAAARGNQ